MEKRFSPLPTDYYTPFVPGTIPNYVKRKVQEVTNTNHNGISPIIDQAIPQLIDINGNPLVSDSIAPSPTTGNESDRGTKVDSPRTPSQIEVMTQQELGYPNGLGSLRNESAPEIVVKDKLDTAIADMLKPDNILSLKEKYDSAWAKLEASLASPFSSDNRLDKDGTHASTLAKAKAALKKQMIRDYTQVGVAKDETPRSVPKQVRRDISNLMNLSYEELEEKSRHTIKSGLIDADIDSNRSDSIPSDNDNTLERLNSDLDAANAQDASNGLAPYNPNNKSSSADQESRSDFLNSLAGYELSDGLQSRLDTARYELARAELALSKKRFLRFNKDLDRNYDDALISYKFVQREASGEVAAYFKEKEVKDHELREAAIYSAVLETRKLTETMQAIQKKNSPVRAWVSSKINNLSKMQSDDDKVFTSALEVARATSEYHDDPTHIVGRSVYHSSDRRVEENMRDNRIKAGVAAAALALGTLLVVQVATNDNNSEAISSTYTDDNTASSDADTIVPESDNGTSDTEETEDNTPDLQIDPTYTELSVAVGSGFEDSIQAKFGYTDEVAREAFEAIRPFIVGAQGTYITSDGDVRIQGAGTFSLSPEAARALEEFDKAQRASQ